MEDKMKIGYACLTVAVADTDMKSCIAKNATNENLKSIISNNLQSLLNMLIYNVKNDIKLLRISSDLIPFGSSSINKLEWQHIFKNEFEQIGEYIRNNELRVSMHPGQYTVLNSVNDLVVQRAIDDLKYHCDILDLMQMDSSHKIILHIGGAYNDKLDAINRFIKNYTALDARIKKRLIIENDDKIYNIREVLDISRKISIPVVYDNLHNYANPYDKNVSDKEWIIECSSTWEKEDGNQKIHYSQQDNNKKTGSHSPTIHINEFLSFYNHIKECDTDIMLEVKDKNISAIKCINLLSKKKNIKYLEQEWSRYNYSVLEKSHKDYLDIRQMLKDKSAYPVKEFYCKIEDALNLGESIPSAVNALQHVWGYFKNKAEEKEKKKIQKLMEDYTKGLFPLYKVKSFLYALTLKYNDSYLIQSYFFHI